jgi:hypothetical protein
MRFLFVIAAAIIFPGVAIFWNLATVGALRCLGINLPFSFPIRFYQREEPELLNALKNRSINTYVFISGVLLFACPLFLGLVAYDYVVSRFVEHLAYGLSYFAESVMLFALLGIGGVWISINNWQKSAGIGNGFAGIGFPMLAIIVLKISIGTMGALTVFGLLIPAALCCLFVYFGIRRIRRASAGSGGCNRPETGAQRDFIAEQFVPSESHKAQQMAMAQDLIAAGLNPEQVEKMLSVPVQPPLSDEKLGDT